MADDSKLKDLPKIPDSVDAALREPLRRMREAIQVLRGNRGDPLDAAITGRTAIAQGIATLKGGGTAGGGTLAGGGGSGSGADDKPDLTPPPAVDGLTVTAGLTNIIVEFAAPTYAQGHGNQRTDIYAVKRDPASTAPAPTFGDAVVVDSVAGSSPVIAISSDLNVQWHVWAKHVTADGVASAAPAGGTNGVVATTGKIGNADLAPLIIEAGNLANNAVTAVAISDDAVTARHLAANSLAVGTAAIQNGAIVNAMIGAAEIDDAKIANVSAGKLTAGAVAVGEYIQSSGYVAGSAGWRINGNGSAEFSFAMIRGQLVAAQIGAGQVDATKINVTNLQAVSAIIGTLRTTTSGARVELKDNKIGVFDSSNVLRLRLGDLSGTF